MSRKSTEEVKAEIEKLRALKPVGNFREKTLATIAIQIEALEGKIDDTTDEIFDLPEEQQMAATDAMSWKNGDSNIVPSDDWGSLVE